MFIRFMEKKKTNHYNSYCIQIRKQFLTQEKLRVINNIV